MKAAGFFAILAVASPAPAPSSAAVADAAWKGCEAGYYDNLCDAAVYATVLKRFGLDPIHESVNSSSGVRLYWTSNATRFVFVTEVVSLNGAESLHLVNVRRNGRSTNRRSGKLSASDRAQADAIVTSALQSVADADRRSAEQASPNCLDPVAVGIERWSTLGLDRRLINACDYGEAVLTLTKVTALALNAIPACGHLIRDKSPAITPDLADCRASGAGRRRR